MEDEGWKPSDFSRDSSSPEELKFILSQAKDKLKEVSDEGDRLFTKSLTLLSISITIIIASGSFLFSKLEPSPLKLSLIPVLFYFWIIASKLRNNIKPRQYEVPGTEPKMLFKNEFYETKYANKSVEWSMIYNEILEYQKRITSNKSVNDSRKNVLHKVYDWIFYAPALFVIVYAMVSLIFFLYRLSLSQAFLS